LTHMPGAQANSISRKLTWMNMLVSSAALLLACTAFIAYDRVTFREAKVLNLSTQAQIIGSNSISALLFNDAQSAENTLSALKAAHNILSAGIYTPDGRLFASYSRDSTSQIPALPSMPPGQAEIHWLKSREIVLVRLILFEGKPTGMVYIRSDVKELNGRMKRYAGIAAIVLAVCLMAALLVSSIFRKSVAFPIVRLAEVARVVSRDKNYSVRATPTRGPGELAILIDAFNEMLSQIQQSERALRKAHDGLEQRVLERTAELEAAKKEVEEFSRSILLAKEEVERGSKFKDQFLSTMSHELRTPLNAVLGFSDLLADERYGPLNERQQRYVSHIHTGGKHLLSLISDILDLSKIEAGRMELAIESLRVTTTLGEVISVMQPLAEKKSQVLTKVADPALSIRADSTRFRQVLLNLVGNAIKFTPNGGRIELSAFLVQDKVRVEVRDNGPGIPPEEQQRIFEAFYRLRETGKKTEGTGLGLAITHRLVELHGGELSLESKVGQGSCFYFSLPAAATISEATAAKAATAPKSAHLPRVLVIEDDRAAAQLIQSQLTSAGYEVMVCLESQNALETAVQFHPGAITLDIVMKPKNGWEVLSQLKRDPRTAQIPLIVVSIVDQPGMGALLGADEYLVKPVEKKILLAALERRINSRTASAHVRPILVVEDDTATREFIAEMLVARGYTVVTAADGAQARAQVAANMPELVILDLVLPEVSGFELLGEWRASPRTADLPVFVLTSKDLNQEEQRYLRAHAESLFRKQQPWHEELVKQLARVVSMGTSVKV
jgi:signal transduction histidine kinase/DNA-binding response OmpR family regulator